jgi:2,5-diamino-6-(ribosylamino)-4(3H)-pyrimidinone 5'-phosphate reductase
MSYIVSGENAVDRVQAVSLLGDHFSVRRLLLEGGGHINGAFLEAGLVDELSLLIAPGMDGRHDIPAVFDGLTPTRGRAVPLRLKSVERRESTRFGFGTKDTREGRVCSRLQPLNQTEGT